MKKFVCTVCGYVHEGNEPPEKCPQCQVPASKFKEQAETGLVYADEHVIGVAKDVDPEIVEGLRHSLPRRAQKTVPANEEAMHTGAEIIRRVTIMDVK